MTVVVDQPFQILLELVQTHKLDPWDVDIEKLTNVFVQRLRDVQELDLRTLDRFYNWVVEAWGQHVLASGKLQGVIESGKSEVEPFVVGLVERVTRLRYRHEECVDSAFLKMEDDKLVVTTLLDLTSTARS